MPADVSIEAAVLSLAAAQVLAPLLRSLLERRQSKHEAAVDQVPLLAQTLNAVASDVREIRAELRVVAEHSTALEVLRGRVGTLERDRDAARERLRDVERELHAVRGQLSARNTHHGTPKPGRPGAGEGPGR